MSTAVSAKLGRRLKFLVGKPGLDGHSNGAEQIAVRARDCGMEVVYEGIRLTPAQIANAAVEGRTSCHRPVDPVRFPPRARARRHGPAPRFGRR
jgi:methylmalonyl-CoA mutase cobalamin-binding subunit